MYFLYRVLLVELGKGNCLRKSRNLRCHINLDVTDSRVAVSKDQIGRAHV